MATRPVVVGVDGSQESLHAAQWAAMEAVRHGAPLRIVSAPAMPPRALARDLAPETVANAVRGMSARALDEAITRAEEVTTGLLIETDILTGPPAVAVTRSGAGALMIVVGARGTGGFAGMLLGSISRYSAMHAQCPVVVVREETTAVTREVAVGIRDPLDTTATLEFAFEEAALRGATLAAVHSCYSLPSVPGGSWAAAGGGRGGAEAERAEAQASQDLADALASWQDKYPDVRVRLDVVHGHPARTLACYSGHADLVVIGRRTAALAGPAIDAVQHAVLYHAHGPVAVVPSRG
jgi:nucleotide-binding universal stress UspA family protein